jgi:hypothetical protein
MPEAVLGWRREAHESREFKAVCSISIDKWKDRLGTSASDAEPVETAARKTLL